MQTGKEFLTVTATAGLERVHRMSNNDRWDDFIGDQWEDFLKTYIKNNPDKSREILETAARYRAIQQKHAEAFAVLYGSDHTAQRKAFLDNLTTDDYALVLKRSAPDGLAEALAIRAVTPEEYEQKITRVYDFFSYQELIEIYEYKHPRGVDILPTSPATHLMNRTIAALLSGRAPSQTKNTELDIRTSRENNSITFIQRGENDVIEFTLKDKDLCCMLLEPGKTGIPKAGRKNGDLRKMLAFILITCNDHGFRSPVTFSLHDLVKVGMYSDYVSARRGFEKNMPRIFNGFDYSIKRKRGGSVTETKSSANSGTGIGEGHGFISSYELPPGSSWVTINIDPNFDISAIAEFYTILPKWALALDPSPFAMVNYIFYRGRQNSAQIADKGYFNVSLDRLRDYMGLPEYTGTNDYNRVKRPIMTALEKVEEAIFKNNDNDLKITPCIKDGDISTATTQKWLFDGFLVVEFSGRYREYFSRRDSSRSRKIEAAKKNGAAKKKRISSHD